MSGANICLNYKNYCVIPHIPFSLYDLKAYKISNIKFDVLCLACKTKICYFCPANKTFSMINKKILMEVMLENREEVMRHNVISRNISLDNFDRQVLVGVRRDRKSTRLNSSHRT